jgi:hypothetical protein
MGDKAHAEFAIDVNIPGIGQEAYDATAKRQMDKMVAAYQARGFRILWNGKVYQPNGSGPSYDIPENQNQHTNHVHIEAPASIVGKPAGSKLASELIADDKAVESEAHKAAREQVEAQAEALDAKKELYHDDLYAQLQAQDEKEAIITAFYGKETKQAQQVHEETLRLERSIAAEELRIAQDTINKKLTIAEHASDAEKAMLAARRGSESDTVDFKSQNGLIGEREALAEKKRILGEEYQDEVNYEDAVYRLKVDAVRQQLELENLTADARRKLLDQLEVMEAEHQAKMTTMKAEYGRSAQQIDIQTAQVSMTTWRNMFSTVTQSLNNTFQGIWTHSMSIWQGLINLGDQIVYKFADMGLKVFQDWLTREAIKLGLIHANEAAQTAAHGAGEAARTGISATGEATRQGLGAAGVIAHAVQQGAKTGASVTSEAVQTGAKIAGEGTRGAVGATGAIAEIGTRAATSAAGAFSSTVVIPFIGPVAAPIAAAAALAAVLGFAALVSARGGQGEVGQDGQLSVLHKKEMVLPAWIAEPLRQQIRRGGSSAPMFGAAAAAGDTARTSSTSNSDANFYYQPAHTLQNVSMSELLRRDGRELRKWLRNEHRNGTLGLGSK